MIFTETKLKGAYIVSLNKREDARGFFARAWCLQEFETHGIAERLVQSNISFNLQKGTLRGMHYQIEPYVEAKLVRCTRGAIYDVIIDLRPMSPTYKQWIGLELTSDNYRMLFVPDLFAHGYQTLEDKSEVFYHVSEFYSPANERGLRWNDPQFKIEWAEKNNVIISEKDSAWPDYATSGPATRNDWDRRVIV